MFDRERRAFIGIAGDAQLCMIPKMANRHGLITGATGTGKTISLQTLAETFSQMGVPVFAADVKGDLSGVAAKGGNKQGVVDRVAQWRLEEQGFAFQAFPVQFWDVFGAQGAPVRAAIGDMGPLLLARLLSLNDTQSGVLAMVFKIAADEKLPLVDLKDMRQILAYVAENASRYSTMYGNVSTASVGAIQRGLVALEHDGAAAFFGEPGLNIDDLLQTEGGKGVINILAADRLMQAPQTYATFLLWLMTRLFDVMPEAGDLDKPRLIFFFDEAHLVFTDAPRALVEKIEQVVRLIRSKGVGIYFVSQSPADIPDSVLAQLGNRVQHALRAYTPKDQKALKAAAQSFRANPAFDTETAIARLGIGEALLSFLDEQGAPRPVERASILPPQGQIGPLDAAARAEMLACSPVYRHYAAAQDRESAFEILNGRMRHAANVKAEAARAHEEAREEAQRQKAEEKTRIALEKESARESAQRTRFWAGVAKSVLAPLARQALGALFRRK